MPRKKEKPRFKYTARKDGQLYVVLPVEGFRHPIWRICREETQEAVDAVIEGILAKVDEHRRGIETPETAGAFFDHWIRRSETRVTKRTLAGYEKNVRLYLKPALGHLQLRDIKPLHLGTLYAELSRRLDPVTIKKVHSVAGSIFKEAVNLEVIPASPAARIKPPRLKDAEKAKALSKAEARRFLEACRESKYGIVFEFALETGMRPQEYLALRWSDVDLNRRTARVVRALVYDRAGGGWEFKDPKSKRSRRSVPLSRQMSDKLAEHKRRQQSYVEELRQMIHRRELPYREHRKGYRRRVIENYAELDLVFPSQDGTPIKDTNLGNRQFKQIMEKAGLDASLGMYALRHTCATLLLAANVNPKIVSERLGHSGVNITLDTYSHVLPTMQATATDELTAALYDAEED